MIEKIDLSTANVMIHGTDAVQAYEVVSILVQREAQKIPSARIVVRDGDAAKRDFKASSGKLFVPGNEVEIKLGYHGKNLSVFQGLITGQAIRVEPGGGSRLVVECRDKAVKMTVDRHCAYFSKMTDGEVMRRIIEKYGLFASVASTTPSFPEITQYDTTDWDFLLTRAEANGFVVVVDSGRVTIARPDPSKSPSLSLTHGFDLLGFSLDLDARTQITSVECSAWDMKSQAMITASQSIQNLNALGEDKSAQLAKATGSASCKLTTSAALHKDSLKAWAQGRLIKSEMSKIRGTIRFQGSASAQPGSVIELNGLGDRFNGQAYLSGVTHRFEEGDWNTEGIVGLSPEWFSSRTGVSATPATGLLPAVSGLQIGVVKQIHQDPENLFRVLVNIAVVGNTGSGIWARLASPYATDKAGHFFYPEVNDEVVLGFLNDDPSFPVILGGLFSSARTPPYTPDQENGNKAIVTKAGLRVWFDDKNRVITVATPNANKVVLSDKDQNILIQDQNGNRVRMSSSGIAIESATNILMKASQNVTIEASAGSMTLKGTQGVSISGLKISAVADTEFTASGGAKAAVTSAGQTQIQGGLVMIN